MRILVTGGAGFIASHIVDQLVAAGHEGSVVDNLWSEGGGKQSNLNSNVHFYHADITDEASLARIFDEVKPEIVSHHAAQRSIAHSIIDPVHDAHVNVLGLLNVLKNCTRIGTRKIIFASSVSTYGTPISLPLDEDTPQRPESPYGITKMVAEHYLRFWHEAHGLTYTVFRYANVYGPRQEPRGETAVISKFIQKFLAHQQIRIDWGGEQRKDYVYIEDVARVNMMAIDRGDNDIFCIGTSKPTSINEIYTLLVQFTGYKPEIIHAPKRPGDIYLNYFDYSKAERILNWKPVVSFEEGLKATVDFLRQI